MTAVTRKNDPRANPLTLLQWPNYLGAPPLLKGEDTAAYGQLRDQVFAALKPWDIVEQFFVWDYINLTWEIFRLRQLKACKINAEAQHGLRSILLLIYNRQEEEVEDKEGSDIFTPRSSETAYATELARKFAVGDKAATQEVSKLLAAAGLTLDDVMARALARSIPEVESFDKMIVSAEVRRAAALRQIENHRETLGQQLRAAVEEFERRQIEGRATVEDAPVADVGVEAAQAEDAKIEDPPIWREPD
jgi:hypothetical protein